jgi:hypothetical protein
MAEILCGNVLIAKSLSGKPYDKPCSGWFGGCSVEDYQDWVNTLKYRIDIARKYYNQLDEISKFSGQASLSDTEKYIGTQIALLKTEYDDFAASLSQPNVDFKLKIKDIQQRISTAACLIQDLQESIENRGHDVTSPSGLIATTGQPSWTTQAAWALALGLGAVAVWRLTQRL